MILKAIFGTPLLLKKVFLSILGIGLIGISIHYGVSKPLNNYNTTHHLEGSQPLLEKNKGNPYDKVSSEAYLVKDFRRITDLPPISPSISEEHLNPRTKQHYLSEFNSEIREYVAKNIDKIENTPEFTILDKAKKLVTHDRKMSSISEIEIPYKSYFFNRQVRQLTKTHIIQDLLWSLIEETAAENTVVRPYSIKIDLLIDKANVSIDEEIEKQKFPLSANTVNNLKIKFTAYNPNDEVKYFFKSIPVLPYQEAHITVFLQQGEIRPFNSPLNTNQPIEHATKWGILATKEFKYEVSVESKKNFYEIKKFSFERLSLLWAKSHFISDEIMQHSLINAPTHNDFADLATESLVGLTQDQVKKDLETWYGALSAFHLKLRIEDIKKLIKIMEMKIFKGKDGKEYSGLEMFINSSTWRMSLYNWIKLQKEASKVVDSFFVDEGAQKDFHLKAKDIESWIKSLRWALDEIASSIQIGVRWLKEPTLSPSASNDHSPFRSVSFKLEQEIKWNKRVIVPFKGCWNEDSGDAGAFEENTKQSECTGSKHYFDLSSKMQLLHEFLKPLQTIVPLWIFNLIPDAEQFLGWDRFEIAADEKILNIYEADHSPIRPSLDEAFDAREQRKIVPGWKALDVSLTYDLANFYKFFYRIYEKIDVYKDKSSVNISNLISLLSSYNSVQEKAKKSPISFAVHIINQLWDKNYWKENNSKEEDRPWPVFFKALLERPFVIDSTQMFIGYSSNMFNIEEWVYEKTISQTIEATSTSKAQKVYKLDKDWQKQDINGVKNYLETEWNFPATFKNKRMEELLKNYNITYSSYYPRDPIVIDFENNKEWEQFLKFEGSTTTGFLQHRDRLKNVLKKYFLQNTNTSSIGSFPKKQLVDWSKIKISFTQLELERALKAVLSLENTIDKFAATFLKVNFHGLLGEFIQRDAIGVTVNFMLEDGCSNIIKNPLTVFTRNIFSLYQFLVKPYFDEDKLSNSAKNLKNLIQKT